MTSPRPAPSPTGRPSQPHLAFRPPSPHQATSRAILWGTGSGYIVLFSPYTNVATGLKSADSQGEKRSLEAALHHAKFPKPSSLFLNEKGGNFQ